MTLPPSILDVIDRVLDLADLGPADGRSVRADLEQHFRDGLSAGQAPEELIRLFGAPETVAPLLARSARSRSRARPRGGAGELLRTVLQDLRFAARVLLRSPTLSVAAVVVLALGLGANIVVFTVVNELLLRPLDVRDQATLVDVWPEVPGGNSFLGFDYQEYLAYRDAPALESLAAFTGRRLTMDDEDRPVVGQLVSPEYFPMLGLSPALGSLTFPEQEFGEDPVAVLAHAFWLESFGGDPAVLGRTTRLNGHPATVVGVGPAGFTGHFIGFPADLWLPITAADPLIPGFDPADRDQKAFEMIGRLRAGTTVEAAHAGLNAIAAAIEEAHPVINRGHRVGVTPTTGLDHSLQSAVTAFAAILVAVSTLVLLIACLNVGGLLLVRAMSREREIAIRLAIGAGRSRLIRQLLTESVLLVGVGAVVGAWVSARLNVRLGELVRSVSAGLGFDLALDWRVLALTAVAALAAAMLATAAPALHLLRHDPAGALRARAGRSAAGGRLRAALVVGQVAVSFVLVVGTGLLVRALVEGARANPGFDADRVATFALSLDPDRYGPAEAEGVQRQLADELGAIGGVEAVTLADGPVLGVARSPMDMEIAGVQPPPGQDALVADVRRVGGGYLATVGIRLIEGRDFTDDEGREGPPVAVVNAAFARRFWPGETAVGRAIVLRDGEVRVVGVAADAQYLIQDPTPDPLVYVSLAGRHVPQAVVHVRAAAPALVTSPARAAVRALAPTHAPIRLRTAREVVRDALFPQRMGSILVGAMGVIALLLASVGLYGTIQYTVSRDAHELGVRLALGGSRRSLLRVVLRKGFLLVAIGMTLGLVGALLSAPGLGRLLGAVSPTDPWTYLTVIASFCVVAFLASWLPALRAARIHPTEALRGE